MRYNNTRKQKTNHRGVNQTRISGGNNNEQKNLFSAALWIELFCNPDEPWLYDKRQYVISPWQMIWYINLSYDTNGGYKTMKKNFFQQLYAVNYAATLMNHGYAVKDGMLSHYGK